ncbi:50S ribosomal protein L6 [Campylobacter sputorum subsp. bubulus]|uniref:Large ribosomal subunit protein uL6 n=1 Tax=Campylobacter sputorum subsp. sputorum TaxID=32024 RepID=A0A381DJJ8_9BACT|nr:50S ribosomal protein L6 [Campylobacter sputorum]ASM35879.1 50S ribosomal protein L6 [Campylobacter sputorum aubsp. sputorum RM3237]ASM37563.1 50S ribosomal protein L6 [Campylobacter sputorum bv. faecalis CCUG 20703]ASM39230.1 50S ribosomal protein L6 [Campylobacter sputorum bv. paraureolyticus LMG 11764]KAB0582387.1 50S ribosomal protein L6 [Campylobacter sputorum subsp. sputorum]MDY6121417.1 50S ribosomal protein L6 [Campylobacter sputorum]
MSRIGKQPISIPSGVDVSVKDSVVVFKKGNTTKELDTKGHVCIKVEDGKLVFASKSDERQDRAYWGTYRALANNVIIGLTSGFEKKLEINGVGYKAAVKGKVLELNLGFSHVINYQLPEGIEASVDKNVITIKGVDKQVVGQVAAQVRGFRPPEPYKGKGVKYAEERIIRKAGKTAKK